MKPKTYIIAAIIFVVLIIAAIIKSKITPKGDEVFVETAFLGSVTESVSANGKVQPEIEVKLSPDVSGEIIELPIQEGQQVKNGDLLAVINPDLLASAKERVEAALLRANADLANAKARLAQSKARLINAEQNFNRNKTLIAQNAISQAEFDGIKAEYDVAKADVEAAEQSVKAAEYNVKSATATLKEAQDNLRRTRIYAPMDGTVSKLSVELGERVVGTSQMAGTEICRIANLQSMEVNVDVNESDIVRLSLNDTADIEVDAYLNRKFTGIVTEIANSSNSVTGITTDQVTSFNVKIRILPESYNHLVDHTNKHLSPFRPGMSATVDIKTEKQNNVLLIPIQAVTLRKDTTQESSDDLYEVVFVVNNNKVSQQKIKTGIQDNKNIQILEGLNEGDIVVAGPYSVISKKLEHNNPVQIVEKEKIFDQKN